MCWLSHLLVISFTACLSLLKVHISLLFCSIVTTVSVHLNLSSSTCTVKQQSSHHTTHIAVIHQATHTHHIILCTNLGRFMLVKFKYIRSHFVCVCVLLCVYLVFEGKRELWCLSSWLGQRVEPLIRWLLTAYNTQHTSHTHIHTHTHTHTHTSGSLWDSPRRKT